MYYLSSKPSPADWDFTIHIESLRISPISGSLVKSVLHSILKVCRIFPVTMWNKIKQLQILV